MTDPWLRDDVRDLKLVTLGDSGLWDMSISIHGVPFRNLFTQRADEPWDTFLTRAFASARQQAAEHKANTAA